MNSNFPLGKINVAKITVTVGTISFNVLYPWVVTGQQAAWGAN